ncbi:CyP450 monooxygenase [Trametopsis cervina]|nr:CyP450 monooxygenase [Trametopsis cervina]
MAFTYTQEIALVTWLLFAIWILRRRSTWISRLQGCSLPLGPKGLPFIGNLLDMRAEELPWRLYRDWSYQYGNLIYLNVLGTPIIVINSVDIAIDLMEKRSSVYSDRPESVMDELIGWDWNVGLMRYGPRWREIRRLIHVNFHQLSVAKYHGSQTRTVHKFLRTALEGQGNQCNPLSFRLAAGTVIADIVYGLEVSGPDDEFLYLQEKALEGLNLSRVPGAYWVDYVPLLKLVPDWFPGAAAKKLGKQYRPIVQKMLNKPFDTVKSDAAPRECIALDLIRKIEKLDDPMLRTEQEEHARDATGILYAATIDTNLGLLTSFLCAMAMDPHIQKRAQNELEYVVGPDRLPTYDDRDSLPFVQAILYESVRWFPALPMGVPRRSTADDYYNGYFIPKGTEIIPNAWAMLHNPDDYPNPERFDPDRFLKDGEINRAVRNPTTIAFGFGRRICPGRHFAQDHVFLMIASILHTFDIEPAVDEYGNQINPNPQATKGITAQPEKLPCVLRARSAAAESLIRLTPQ